VPDITSIRGLPAHPLFAHVPVILIPLAGLGAVAMLWPAIRDRIGWYIVGLVFVAGIFTQLTISAGQSLRKFVRESPLVRAHTRIGENIRPWVLLMFLALLGVMLLARREARAGAGAEEAPRSRKPTGLRVATLSVATLSIVFSGVATYWIYRIGDSGAKAVWAPTQTRIDRGVRAEGGRDSH
jgi:hypothetical protein